MAPMEEHVLKGRQPSAPLKLPHAMAAATREDKALPSSQMVTQNLKPFAQQYARYGLSCLPVQKNKLPKRGCRWKEEIPDHEFTTEGIAIKCGRASGGLECLDFDNHFGDAGKNLQTFLKSVKEITGKYDFPIQSTQSKGYHLLYKCNTHGNNQKLAQRTKNGKPVSIVEIRGEGGYFVAAPTPGYSFIQNGIENISRITREDRKIIIEAAGLLNEYVSASCQKAQQSQQEAPRIYSHVLEDRRYRAPLKIPMGMATVLCKDKTLLKALAVYFSLKPLYYSGVITKAKSRYEEIAGYIGISPSNLRSKLAYLKKHKLVKFDHKRNLHLCSFAALCAFINKKHSINFKNRKLYELLNEGQTECRIRTLAVHESRLKQKNAVEAKIFSNERFSKFTEKMAKGEKNWSDWLKKLMQEGVSPEEAWDRYHQHITKITYKNRTLRKEKRIMLNYYTPNAPKNANLLCKYEDLYDHGKKGAELPRINPHLTLSCMGLAQLYGSNKASNGHYWQRKLQDMGLLNISPHHLRIQKDSAILKRCLHYSKGMYDAVTEERIPIYTRTTRKGETLYFLTLPNRLVPVLNTTALLPGGNYTPLCV